MSSMRSIIVKSTDNVDTFDYQGPIGDLLVNAGLPKAEEYAVEFHEDMMEVRLDAVYFVGMPTNDCIWDGNDGEEWTDNDDVIVEAFEAYIYNNYDGRTA